MLRGADVQPELVRYIFIFLRHRRKCALVVQRVGQIHAFEAGLHRIRDGGQSELAHVAIDERISLVSVGAFKKQRPLNGSAEEFASMDLLVRGKLPAGDQEAELVFLGQSADQSGGCLRAWLLGGGRGLSSGGRRNFSMFATAPGVLPQLRIRKSIT